MNLLASYLKICYKIGWESTNEFTMYIKYIIYFFIFVGIFNIRAVQISLLWKVKKVAQTWTNYNLFPFALSFRKIYICVWYMVVTEHFFNNKIWQNKDVKDSKKATTKKWKRMHGKNNKRTDNLKK